MNNKISEYVTTVENALARLHSLQNQIAEYENKNYGTNNTTPCISELYEDLYEDLYDDFYY